VKRLLFLFIVCMMIAGSVYAQESTPETAADVGAQWIAPEATAEATTEPTPTPITPLEFDEYGVFYDVSQSHEGLRRRYLLYIPPNYDPEGAPIPLIVALHPANSNSEGFATFSGFDVIGERENAAVVYPNGINFVWNDGRVGDPRVQNVDDVTFIQSMIEVVSASLNIDQTRIYAAGYSMGGMLAYRLGCRLPDTFAAVASVASTMPRYVLDECESAPPVSLIVLQGTDDFVVPWAGIRGENGYLSAAETIQFWRDHNVCSPEITQTVLPDVDPNDGTRVIAEHYNNCRDNSRLAFYGVYFGGHTYPGHPLREIPGVDLTTRDIFAEEVIWEFFASNQ